MKKYVLALDQGTTSSRAILFDKAANIVAIEQKEFTQHFPHPGWVEHNANEIWESQMEVAKAVLYNNNINAEEIDSIGITNQRETTILWQRSTGKAIYNALVWQDNRTKAVCEKLKENDLEEYVRKNTGLVIDSYFSGTKINWLLENVPQAKELATQNDLCFGTVDSWLIWKLTKGKKHITDYSNASRTLVYNIKNLDWDNKLLNALNVPAHILPKVVNSSGECAKTDTSIFGVEIPICGIAGDQQAALFGQQCLEKGMAKNTYGTGCFMLMQTGEELIESKNGLLTTIAWGKDEKINYALEGSIFIAGAAIKWLRDGLKMIENAEETETIATSIDDSEGVILVPAFVGLGAPYWNMNVKGAMFGLTRGTTKAHFVRATLESLAYQTKDVLTAMEEDSGIKLNELKVDGGACNNNFLMQFQSDILNTNVVRPKVTETTALGAALLAGKATGFFQNSILEAEKTFTPKMEEHQRSEKYKGWKNAVKKLENNH